MGLIERIIETKMSKYGIPLLVAAVLLSIFAADFTIDFFKHFLRSRLGTFQLRSFDWDFRLPQAFDAILFLLVFGVFMWVLIRLLGNLLWPYIIQPLYQWCRYFLRIDKEITGIEGISGWEFQGSLKIQPYRSLEITSSNSGALIKRPLYKDFTMSFKTVIQNGGGLAILFRAQDLENYLMLQIGIRD